MRITMKKMTRKKKTPSKFSFFPFVATIFLIFAIAVLAVSNVRIYERRANLQNYINEKEEELRVLKERINETQESGPDGPDDDFMIEKMAREQLLLKRPGEEVIFITFPETETGEEVEKEEKESIWWNPLTWKID